MIAFKKKVTGVVFRLQLILNRCRGLMNHKGWSITVAPGFFRWKFSIDAWFITGRNEVVAKVMFLQVCVCPQGEGVCLSACWDARTPPPTRQTPPRPGRHPPDQADTPPNQADTPPGSRLQHTVYERPVRILLECILVLMLDALKESTFIR